MRNFLTLALLAAIFILPHSASAEVIDGSSPCLCAITDVVECDSVGNCAEVEPEEVNIPTFIRIDLENKKLMDINSTGSKTTAIKNIEQAAGKLILQGAENQRAWSMMVTKDTGEMSASVSGEDYGFLLFGDCTVLP